MHGRGRTGHLDGSVERNPANLNRAKRRETLKSVSRLRFHYCENVVEQVLTPVGDFIQTSGN